MRITDISIANGKEGGKAQGWEIVVLVSIACCGEICNCMKTRLYNKSIAGLIFNALNASPMIESCTCPPLTIWVILSLAER
jgi:hypothetical protein